MAKLFKKKSIFFTVIFVFTLLTYFLLQDSHTPTGELSKADKIEALIIDAKNEESQLEERHLIKEEENVLADSSGFLPGPRDAVQKKFQTHIEALENCLGIKVGETDIFPNADNFIRTIKTSFGEPKEISTDWSNTILFDKYGNEKRVRIELEALDENQTRRVLAVFNVNSEGEPVGQAIPEEHRVNPSETVIANYINQIEVKVREVGLRLDYDEPIDVFLIQRNEALTDIEVSVGDKSFHCRSVHSLKSECQCLN